METSVRPFSQERIDLARQTILLSKKERDKLNKRKRYERRFQLPAKDLEHKEVQTEDTWISSAEDTIRSLHATICQRDQELEVLRQRCTEQVPSSKPASDPPRKVKIDQFVF